MKKNKARSSNKGEITSISPKQLETIQRQIKISSGPIPSAEELSKYNKIEPELVNRIVSMAENQQNHRLNSEKKTIYKNLYIVEQKFYKIQYSAQKDCKSSSGAFAIAHILLKAISLFWLNRWLIWMYKLALCDA